MRHIAMPNKAPPIRVIRGSKGQRDKVVRLGMAETQVGMLADAENLGHAIVAAFPQVKVLRLLLAGPVIDLPADAEDGLTARIQKTCNCTLYRVERKDASDE